MITVNDQTKQAYLNDSTHKVLTISFPNAGITYTNNDIVAESLELQESVNGGENLTFEGCIAAEMKFKCSIAMSDLRGEYVEVSIVADNTQSIPVFKGYVDKQTNLTHQDILTEITAYDVLYKLKDKDVMSWYKNLSFPKTLKSFRDSFFQQIGIAQETTTLPNDSLSLSKSIKTETLNALDLLKWICQANARFGKIGRDGVFHYIKLSPIIEGLYPSNELFPANDLYPRDENANIVYTRATYSDLQYEPYTVQRVTGVKIFNANDVATFKGSNQDNCLCIVDNPIAYGMNMNTVAQNIYNDVKLIEYIPTEINCKGLPFIETGDIVTAWTRTAVVRTYVITRTLSGVQALTDNYISEGDEYQEQYKASKQSRDLAQERYERKAQSSDLYTEIDVVDGRITTEISNRRSGDEELSSTINQTISSISLNVTNGSTVASLRLDAETVGGSTIRGQAKEITFDGLVAFTNLETVNSATKINGGNIIADTISLSKINGLDGELDIQSNRISIDSTNFKLTKAGTITANSGTIGPFSIGSNGLSWRNSAVVRVTSNDNVLTLGNNDVAVTQIIGDVIKINNSPYANEVYINRLAGISLASDSPSVTRTIEWKTLTEITTSPNSYKILVGTI